MERETKREPSAGRHLSPAPRPPAGTDRRTPRNSTKRTPSSPPPWYYAPSRGKPAAPARDRGGKRPETGVCRPPNSRCSPVRPGQRSAMHPISSRYPWPRTDRYPGRAPGRPARPPPERRSGGRAGRRRTHAEAPGGLPHSLWRQMPVRHRAPEVRRPPATGATETAPGPALLQRPPASRADGSSHRDGVPPQIVGGLHALAAVGLKLVNA